MPDDVGLKCGIEIHQQLATRHKLFCECSAAFEDEKPVFGIERRLRPVAGEMGDVDAAAAFEALRKKAFVYKVYVTESCAVEMDEEPPHALNDEALGIGLKIAQALNCAIPDELHVMRKQVIDGSNTSGFQRTVIVGLNGSVETASGKVGITNVCLEEDSCQIIKRGRSSVVYGLSRLGIPLVEIGTAPDIKTPEQAREVAEKVGMLIRETGKAKRGIGTIRQDINVSIKGGTRVEIKGVQELKMIPEIVMKEVERQAGLVKKGKEVPKEVRKAEQDGSTSFLRPLPGAARLYPETDIQPITITDDMLRKASEISDFEKEKERHAHFLVSLGFSRENAGQMILKGTVRPDKIILAEKLVNKFLSLDKKLIWNIVTEVPKDIKSRYNARTENLSEKHFESIIQKLARAEISKESVPDILNEFCKKPDSNIESIMKSMGIKTLSPDELRKIIRKVIDTHSNILGRPGPEKALMGLVMKEVRGRVAGEVVMKILVEEIKKHKNK